MTQPLSGLPAIKLLSEKFEAVEAYLQAVHEILEEGHMPDIAGLDDRISDLCTSVQGVTPDIQERCMTKLDALMQKLNNCEEEMTSFHEAQKQSIAQ